MFWKFSITLQRIYRIFLKSRKRNLEKKISTVDISNETSSSMKEYEEPSRMMSEDEKIRLSDLLKKIRLNISLWEYDIAKNLIVEWLTIDKFHIDINLELASIYILEKDYHKAEYIYKDLLLVHNDDFLTLKKLAYILALQEKYDLALEVYKKAFDINEEDLEVMNMLANLCYHKEFYIDAIEYLKKYLKNAPRDGEWLILLWASYRAIGEYDQSLFTYRKILEIQPYNEAVKQEIEDLYTFTQKTSIHE